MSTTQLTRLHREAHAMRKACQQLRAAALQFETQMAEVDRMLAAITPRIKRRPTAQVVQLRPNQETSDDQTI